METVENAPWEASRLVPAYKFLKVRWGDFSDLVVDGKITPELREILRRTFPSQVILAVEHMLPPRLSPDHRDFSIGENPFVSPRFQDENILAVAWQEAVLQSRS